MSDAIHPIRRKYFKRLFPFKGYVIQHDICGHGGALTIEVGQELNFRTDGKMATFHEIPRAIQLGIVPRYATNWWEFGEITSTTFTFALSMNESIRVCVPRNYPTA